MALRRGKGWASRGFWLGFVLFGAFAFFTACQGKVSSQPSPVREGTEQSAHGGLTGYLETGMTKVEPLLRRYGYAAVFFAIFLEGFGVIAPGQTLLMAGSFESARGHLSIAWVLLSALAAAILGNLVGYLIGRWGGRALLRKVKVNEAHLARVESYFSRRGAVILLIARFFDGLRQLNGIVAGLLGMTWGKFLPLNAAGAIIWTGVWGVGVYELDRRIIPLHHRYVGIQPIALALSIAAVVVLIIYIVWRRRGKDSSPDR
jgi:membrane protein DedA with SNARE-associated domain